MDWHELAHREVADAERTYQVYTEYAAPDANIIGWLTSARRALGRGQPTHACSIAAQIQAEVYRLSVANGLVRANR